MSDLDGLMQSDHWYKAMIVAGIALAIGALGFHERDFALMGVGLAVGGFGEWLNHRFRQRIYPGGVIVNARSRNPTVVGHMFDAVGLAVFCAGLIRAVW